MEDKKNIDELVRDQRERRAALDEVRRRIRESVRNAAVVFIDLCGSTALKSSKNDEDWLAHVYDFIIQIEASARASNGTVVKRIGDEVMVSFSTADDAEGFIDSLAVEEVFGAFEFKVAADFGPVYFLKFHEHLENDPYGHIVDRCARIAQRGRAGVILCSSSYSDAIKDKRQYTLVGRFPFHGFQTLQEIWCRMPKSSADTTTFHEPLLKTLNDPKTEHHGYRYVNRKFSVTDFAAIRGNARPFLLRELLCVPKLPLSFSQFREHLKSLTNEEDQHNFYGFMVEWEAVFENYHRIGNEIHVYTRTKEKDYSATNIMLQLPDWMFDTVRMFLKGDVIRFRGIICRISLCIEINYVDLAIPVASI